MKSRIDIPVCHRKGIPVCQFRWHGHSHFTAIALAIASCLLVLACDKNPSRENADIQLNAYANGSGGVELSWTVIRKPSGGTWSCHLRRADSDSDNWTELGEFFPDDEFRTTDSHVSAGSSYKYQVTARSMFETRYSNIVYGTP